MNSIATMRRRSPLQINGRRALARTDDGVDAVAVPLAIGKAHVHFQHLDVKAVGAQPQRPVKFR